MKYDGVIVADVDCIGIKGCCTAGITELADGQERSFTESWEEMSSARSEWDRVWKQ